MFISTGNTQAAPPDEDTGEGGPCSCPPPGTHNSSPINPASRWMMLSSPPCRDRPLTWKRCGSTAEHTGADHHLTVWITVYLTNHVRVQDCESCMFVCSWGAPTGNSPSSLPSTDFRYKSANYHLQHFSSSSPTETAGSPET